LIEVGGALLAAGAGVFGVFHVAGWNAPFGFVVSWYVLFCIIYRVILHQTYGEVEARDRMATMVIVSGAVVALMPLLVIIWLVLQRGLTTALTGFPHFLTHDLRGIQPNDPVSKAGMKHAIIGTIEQVGIATLVTVPIGVGTALYLNEIGGRLAATVRLIVDAMSGVPSVIAGLFVYIFWVQPRNTEGFSGVAASMALGILMLPTITRTAEEVLRIVASSLREAALALGAPEWRMICMVVIPTARAGLVTAGILGVARAVGETAPVLLTAFGSRNTNWNPFHGPQADLPLQVYQLARSPLANNVKEAWAGAAVLIAIVLTLFTLARILSAGGSGRRRQSSARTDRLRTPPPTEDT